MMRVVAVALALMLGAMPAGARPRPRPLSQVGVDEHAGDRLPLELVFSDTAGQRVQLGELFADGKPVLLALTYVRCRMLCSLVLRGLTTAVRELPLELGRNYRVITVSLDPHEDAASGAARRRALLASLGATDSGGWTYLVGAERPIRALADSLGFRYAWDPQTEQYAHPAVVFVITPDGRIARYLHGVEYTPAVVADALRAAGRDEVLPTAIAEAVLDCFRFDPAARVHRARIETYLRIGGAALTVALATTIALLFAWERRRRRST